MDSFDLDLAALIASAPTVPTMAPTQTTNAEGMTYIDLSTFVEPGQLPVDEERSHGSFTGHPAPPRPKQTPSFPPHHPLGAPPSRVQQLPTVVAPRANPVYQPYLYSSDIRPDNLLSYLFRPVALSSGHDAVFGQFTLFDHGWPALVEDGQSASR
ncbi:uncharacterized protein SCHCODRAFT_02679747 [Schizophyllum commune H4-8]|uniref:Uncharacterized protein n=1 Tax=Schizophyllum commune (strain H4-8 / FGSC 9210) TaxID=578458 RepID=D8QB09_SCHCM|nr:uncharacterized protein SCHCODRAFT_02679747 [Schizophyllum commune H4-8]KAI5888990.1 hypothetical protein SCHCODRAFT_02679747 [Schizophyllum commune H4-8]